MCVQGKRTIECVYDTTSLGDYLLFKAFSPGLYSSFMKQKLSHNNRVPNTRLHSCSALASSLRDHIFAKLQNTRHSGCNELDLSLESCQVSVTRVKVHRASHSDLGRLRFLHSRRSQRAVDTAEF